MLPALPMTPTRYLLGVLVPGALATMPWLALARRHFGSSMTDAIESVMTIAIVATVGGLLESVGTCVEHRWDQEGNDRTDRNDHWYQYLCRKHEKEPVAYRYISHLVAKMYFELSMMIAVPAFAVGLVCLLRELACGIVPALFVGLALLIAFFLHRQARCGYEALCKVRREIARRDKDGRVEAAP